MHVDVTKKICHVQHSVTVLVILNTAIHTLSIAKTKLKMTQVLRWGMLGKGLKCVHMMKVKIMKKRMRMNI